MAPLNLTSGGSQDHHKVRQDPRDLQDGGDTSQDVSGAQAHAEGFPVGYGSYPGMHHVPHNMAPPPPVQRKMPPVPPYPGTEHFSKSYPGDPIVTKDGDLVPPGPPMGPGGAAIVVRAEEALLILLVLVLWVAAIALFFNRWGKIRMLEPYQPKFQQHRQSCALVDISGSTQHHRLSKLGSLGEPVMLTGPPGPAARAQLLRPRQNSVFVGASPAMYTAQSNPPRKVKSAMDLQTLVLSEQEPGMAASTSSMLPTMASSASPSMRRASHVPIGSARHHASFSHASFSEGPSCSYRATSCDRPDRLDRLTIMDKCSHGSSV